MPTALDTRKHIARLAGEILALRAVVRRLLAHVAVLDGGEVAFLRDELFVVLEELDQFENESLSKRDRAEIKQRAQEILNEAFTTIDIGGEAVSADD